MELSNRGLTARPLVGGVQVTRFLTASRLSNFLATWFLAVAFGLSFCSSASAQNAANGASLWKSKGCGTCHLTPPGPNPPSYPGIKNAADAPQVIAYAIVSIPTMNSSFTYNNPTSPLSLRDAGVQADIAAYIGQQVPAIVDTRFTAAATPATASVSSHLVRNASNPASITTVVLDTAPNPSTQGTVGVFGSSITFSPVPGFAGNMDIFYHGVGGSTSATRRVRFTGSNGPPAAPTPPAATAGNAQATVSFTPTPAALNGGSAITQYRVTASPGGATNTGAGSPIAVAGLNNGTAYTFTVTATNGLGTSSASTASNSVTPTGPPGAPTGANATPGNAQATVTFTPPASNGGSAITGYTVTSNPAGGIDSNAGSTSTSHVITGLTNGTSYTFTVTATNAAGTGPASAASKPVTPVDVPGPPTGANATAGNAQATVTFTPPASNGGSPITGYTVTSSPAGGIDSNAGSTSTSHVITGLTNGTSYTFTVTATNSVGTGPPSAASKPVTPVGPPSAPTGASATAGNTQATVTFTPPGSNGGSAITGYTVISNPAGGIDSNAGSTSTSHVMTGLTNGVAYTFTVVAANSVGSSSPSAASNSVIPAGVPGAPTNASANAGNTQATVTFTPPASDGGSAITGYTVRSNPVGGTDSNAGSTSTSHVMTGLTNGVAYTFTVVATNSVGTGAASAPSNSVVPASVPGAPTNASATAGNAQSTVTFTPPASNGGSAITGYTVVSNPAGGTDSNAGSTSTSHVMTGLVNGTTYTFTVVAANSAGTGPASGPSNAVIPATVPGAPVGASAAAGNGQATVTFNAPASNGGSAITGYTVVSNPAGGVDTNAGTTATTHVVTGLANGTAYTFTVVATNGVGAGPASPASNSVTPANVPGAPTGASATAGNAQATVTFNPPASIGGSAITGYTVVSNPAGGVDTNAGSTSTSHVITGLTNGVSYTFTVRATNSVGTGPVSAPSNSVIPATVPGAPANAVAAAGNTQATVTFTPPASNGGSAITGYTVISNPAGGTDSNAGSTSTSHVITGLTNGVAYTFSVVANNGVGTGPPSSPSNSVTPAGLPGAPTGANATAGNAQATVTFTPPVSSGGSAITGYTVVSNPAGGVDTNAGSTSTSHVVSGLANGTAYTFTVVATNGIGTGPASAATNSVTPTGVPGAPTGVNATAGSAQASVTFSAPASNGGAAITGYTVVSNPPGGVDTNAGTTSTNHLVTGLTNGVAYTFTVTATNVVGTSAASTPSNSVVPANVPGPPTGANATAGNSQATVTFTPPASDGGSAITGYTVISNPPGGIDSNAGAVSTSHLITGLANGTSYTFTVRATNAAGTSLESAASNSVTPAGGAGAPTGVSATAGNAQATVSFTPGASNGSPITGYTVVSNPPGGVDTNAGTTATNHLVTGLTNGVAYTFTVTATNALGTSPASAASNSVTPAGLPGAPTGASATAGNTQATVTFTPPASNGGSAITGYTVMSNPPGGIDSNAGSTSTTHLVTGLTNGVAYTFSVVAANAIGTGASSAASNSVTPAGLPGAPSGVSATAGNSQATVTFNVPASNGGAAITGYTVVSNPAGGVDTNAGSLSTSHVVIGLVNGTAYTFTVTASNSLGAGPASGASNSVTPTGVPGAPTGVSATAGNTQATVTFTPPASNGGLAISGYTVVSTPPGGIDSNAGSTSTSRVMTGLTNGVAYTFTVTATNTLGTGPASAASNIVTPASIPEPPTGVNATAGNTQATVTFTPPANNGGAPISGYTVISNPAGGIDTSAGSTSTIHFMAGLSNGTAYTFTVIATNGAGTSAASAPSNSVTPAGVPGAPTIGTATGGNEQATVAFTGPANDGGAPVTQYRVTASPGGATSMGAGSPIVVTGLANGTAYTFTVTAANSVGTGPASAPSNSVTPAGVPGVPTIGIATAGNAQATVAFTAPANNGGAPVTQYRATASPGGATNTGSGSPIVVTGLSNGTPYTFTVTATNAAGTSAPSAPSNSVTPVAPITVAATLMSPSGNVSTTTPAFTWTAVSNATAYDVYVGNTAGTVFKITQTLTATEAGCAAGTGTCTYTPAVALDLGPGSWWVRARNAAGNGPWSSGMLITVSAGALPGALTLMSPSGNIGTRTPTFTWAAVGGSTSYDLFVGNTAGTVFKVAQNVTATEAGCAAGTGTCTFTPTTLLDLGPGSWWVRARNAAGPGPWSSGVVIVVSAGPLPGAITSMSPSGNLSTTLPSFTWNAVSDATTYEIYIADPAGVVQKLRQTLSATQAGCATNTGACTFTPASALEVGPASWWVRGQNAAGNGPWSSGVGITISAGALPGAVTSMSPSGNVTTALPTFTWNALSDATGYEIYIADPTGAVQKLRLTLSAADAACATGTGTCSFTPTSALDLGVASWWMRAKNAAGNGPWSSGVVISISAGPLPAAVTSMSPSGNVSTTLPTFTWNAVSDATAYEIYIADPTGAVQKLRLTLSAAQAGCPTGTGSCTFTPASALEVGVASWWMRAVSAAGNGPWSSGVAITISAGPLPGAVTPLSPSGNVSTALPTFTWNAVSDATAYEIYVADPTGSVQKLRLTLGAAQAGCAGGTGTCSFTPASALDLGAAGWWIRARNASGNGPWSSGVAITLSAGVLPGAIAAMSPSGSINTTLPAFTWNAVSDATGYEIYVADPAGVAQKLRLTLSAADAGCAAGTGRCSFTPASALDLGVAGWWVRARNAAGNGPWSSGVVIAITPCTPSGVLPDALLACRNWIAFAPPRPFNPNANIYPSEPQLRTALTQLHGEGWRGLVTYSLDGTLQHVPRIAKEVGFTSVIAGLFWFDDAQLARERTAALAQLAFIDAYVLGNEGVQNARYTSQRLATEVHQLKTDTRRPVATTETVLQYQNDPTLASLGDWIFPNVQFWFDASVRTPALAVDSVRAQLGLIQALAPGRTLVAKEAWWPTAGEAAATQANQTEFFRQLSATDTKFVYGEAFDQFWKSEALGQGPNWGLHTDTATPKQAIEALRGLYMDAY